MKPFNQKVFTSKEFKAFSRYVYVLNGLKLTMHIDIWDQSGILVQCTFHNQQYYPEGFLLDLDYE
jgi:sRNA-binding regulator protein Hfq